MRSKTVGIIHLRATGALLLIVMLAGYAVPLQGQTYAELLARADSLREILQFDSAAVLAQEALRLAERDFGAEDTSVARVLHRTGVLNYDRGRYSEAEPLYLKALAIRERVLGPDHPDVAMTLNNLGNVYWIQGRFAEAETLHRRALAIRESALGLDNPAVGMSLICLSNLFYDQGLYSEAEPLCKRALEINERALGPSHPSVALNLNNLGNLHQAMGRYVEAERLFIRALTIREKALGFDHPEVARNLICLASLYNDEGRIADAIPLYNRALAIQESTLGPDHPDLAWTLMNLANAQMMQGRELDAEPLFRRALEIRERAFGAEHPDVAVSLNGRGWSFMAQGRYADAEPLFRRVLEIQEKVLRPNHPMAAWSLNNLTIICLEQGRNIEAESFGQRALQIREQTFGSDHPLVADALNCLALAALARGDSVAAVEREARAWDIRRKTFRDGADVLAERNALEYSQFLKRETSDYLTSLLDLHHAVSVNSQGIAKVVFSTKSQVTDGIITRNRVPIQNTQAEVTALADSLKRARFALSKLFVKGPEEMVPEAYQKAWQTATVEKERLEAELARRSGSFAREQTLWDIDAASVASTLPPGAALVEFVKYNHRRSFKDFEPRYLAILLKGDGIPMVFPLGVASAMDTAVWYYRQRFRDVHDLDQAAYAAAADNLYSLAWLPFASLLEGASTVFIAPDGNLNLVSFAGLLNDNDKYLIEDYPIQYLSSGRDLIRLQDPPRSGSGLLAMGDPDFNAAPQRDNTPVDTSTVPAGVGVLLHYMNTRSACEELSKLDVPALPATRREVEAVWAQWHSSQTESGTLYTGRDATEDIFKQQAPGKRMIHLATHGFYLADECKPKSTARVMGMGMGTEGFVGENPLLQCGFLLAGAKRHDKGAAETNREDGVVTAEEVAGLNLQGTDLVVLSACETGLGEVKSGEGVYGLRRAFQMAGARTVISALWQVNDKATADLMSQIFGASASTLPVAMQQAAVQAIQTARAAGQSDHPYYWAAFVATGDWRLEK